MPSSLKATIIKKDGAGIVGQPKQGYPDGIEGGDSLNWQGHYYFLRNFPNKRLLAAAYVADFESPRFPGLYVRHPNPKATKHGFGAYCEGNFRGCESRDQMTGKLCFLSLVGPSKALLRTFKQHLCRGLLFANNTIRNGEDPRNHRPKLPDLTGPDIWSLYIRGFRLWPLYPLLIIFDLHLFLTAVLQNFKKDPDIISHVIKVLTAQTILPTPLGWLAAKVLSQEHVLTKLLKYWGGFRQQPGMYQLYVPWIKKYWRA